MKFLLEFGNDSCVILQLRQSENRWLRPEEKEKGLCEEDKKTAVCYFISQSSFSVIIMHAHWAEKERLFVCYVIRA